MEGSTRCLCYSKGLQAESCAGGRERFIEGAASCLRRFEILGDFLLPRWSWRNDAEEKIKINLLIATLRACVSEIFCLRSTRYFFVRFLLLLRLQIYVVFDGFRAGRKRSVSWRYENITLISLGHVARLCHAGLRGEALQQHKVTESPHLPQLLKSHPLGSWGIFEGSFFAPSRNLIFFCFATEFFRHVPGSNRSRRDEGE